MSHSTAVSAEHACLVIMAGGTGTRLWPLSRKSRPKQFQKLTGERTLLQETYDRACLVVPKERVFVSTALSYHDLVSHQLPELPSANILIEPEARNTAPAIALVAAVLEKRDPEAVIATIASDHAIHNPEVFVESLKTAFASIFHAPDKLCTIGINPTRPDTGLGYIKMGAEFETENGDRVFLVEDFKEKPDRDTAETYIADWRYLWNAGYFIFSAKSFSQWTGRFAPELHDAVAEIVDLSDDDSAQILERYRSIPAEAVEPLIVERLSPEERLVIPAPLRWSDVGNWNTLYHFLSEKMDASVVSGGRIVDQDSHGVLALDEGKLIVTLGLKDIVIIDTKDALLVADRKLVADQMKSLLKKVAETEGDDYL